MMVLNAESSFLIGPFNSIWKHKHMDALLFKITRKLLIVLSCQDQRAIMMAAWPSLS